MNDGTYWPKISIITPSYNQGKFIEETIRSVILQGYPNLEFIIYEDCSTDDSLDIIKKYENDIKLIQGNINKGMSWGINKGFEASSGDIVTGYLAMIYICLTRLNTLHMSGVKIEMLVHT